MKSYSQILLTILALVLGFGLVVAGLLIGVYYYVAPGLPQAAELRDIKIQIPLQVYSRDGRLIAAFPTRTEPTSAEVRTAIDAALGSAT